MTLDEIRAIHEVAYKQAEEDLNFLTEVKGHIDDWASKGSEDAWETASKMILNRIAALKFIVSELSPNTIIPV